MGHGDRWSAFHADGFQHAMQLLFPGGTVINGRRRPFDTPAGRFERTPNAVFGRSGLFGLCALIMPLENEERRTLMTAYPFPLNGVKHRVTIFSVKEECLGLEGWIDAGTDDGFPITFFASDYFVNSHRYKVGATLDVMLGGLAYKAGADDIAGNDPAASLTPLEGWEPFDYTFQGRIKAISTDIGGEHQQVHLPVMTRDGKAFDLKILCTRSRTHLPPVGEFIAGQTCVMGYMADLVWPEHGVA